MAFVASGPKHIRNDQTSQEFAFSRHKNLGIRLRDCAGRECNSMSLKKEPITDDDFDRPDEPRRFLSQGCSRIFQALR